MYVCMYVQPVAYASRILVVNQATISSSQSERSRLSLDQSEGSILAHVTLVTSNDAFLYHVTYFDQTEGRMWVYGSQTPPVPRKSMKHTHTHTLYREPTHCLGLLNAFRLNPK